LEFLPFSKLKQPVSPRVRNVLEASYQLSWKELEAGIKRTLDEFERELFRQAEKAPSNDAQNRLFEALKVVRKSNSQVLIAARNIHQSNYLAILQPPQESEQDGKSFNRNSLTLVDPSVLEVELATSELAARAEMRCSAVLQHMAVRFSVLAGGYPRATDEMPVGPHQILSAVNLAIAGLDIHVKLKVEFFRSFEKLYLLRMPELLEAQSAQFVELRVLPNLNLGLSNKKEREEKPKDAAKETEKEEPTKAEIPPEDVKPPSAARRPAGEDQSAPRPVQPSGPGRSSEPHATESHAQHEVSRPAQAPQGRMAPTHPSGAGAVPGAPAGSLGAQAPRSSFSQGQGQGQAQQAAEQDSSDPSRTAPSPQTQTSPGRSAHRQSAQEQVDVEMFTTLRELLAGKRASTGELDASQSDMPMVKREDVQSVLTVLQGQNAPPVMVAGKWRTRRVADVKQDLLQHLKQINGRAAQLPQEDSDTIDLVGMLFDHVLQDTKTSGAAQSLLSKLQVPVIKVALKDKGFFARRNHPARQLLNSVAETSLFWMDGSDTDQALMDRMQLVVSRVVAEAEEDGEVFDSMLADLNRHVDTIQKKAEVSEKRHVEAARGKERLEVARKAASEAINDCTRDRLLPQLVSQLLEGAWTDLLALTRLRESVDSDVYVERIDAAQQLARCFDLDNPVPKSDFEEIRSVLEEGMAMVGFHPPEIDRTLNAVSELVVEGEAILPSLDPAEEMEVTKLVAAKSTRAQEGEDGKPVTEKQSILAHLRKEDKLQLSVKEQQTLERLKQLPFGTWFEFVTNQQGEVARRKLSWFSPVTSRCLFVNARGMKVEERSMEQLARDLVRGNCKVWEPQNESMIDRAWKSIKNTLKGWSGSNKSLDELLQSGAA
jgi:hypothetical protein